MLGKISTSARSLILAAAAALASAVATSDSAANICWGYSGVGAVNPHPWATMTGILGCAGHPAGSTAGQVLGEEHRNWHCRFPIPSSLASPASQDAYGRAFMAFHRQFIFDFDKWRLDNTTFDRLEIWDPFQGAQVPGEDETTSTAFTHCSNPANVRPAGAVCTNCQTLPGQFVGGNLDSFDNLGEVGYELELDWHGSYHNGVRVLGCPDIGGFLNTPRDTAFWMAHKKLDEVAREWQSRQATDVVIVVDRSGSMDNNCSSASPPANEHPCSINDAREAARHFAKLMLDVRLDGGGPALDQHRVGLVSFATGATNELSPAGLVVANGAITENAIDDTDLEIGLAGISAGGNTSIAAGIREAIAILNAEPDPNRHQAILVLTDGKENTAPCLEGTTPPCLSADVLTSAEVGDTQIVAIGIGQGAEESHLRTVAERHGGIFLGLTDINATMELEKFFVTAFGAIFDAGIANDPVGVLMAGMTATPFLPIPICDDQRLTVVGGTELPGRNPECELELELLTPAGNQVMPGDSGVESGRAQRQGFLHVNLPFSGEQQGTWQARLVRRGDGQRCDDQTYYLSSLARGLGRVHPFAARPNIVPGRPILATFRINESNRPKGGFDTVKADVELTRPGGAVQSMQLFDDGTNGDKLARNNIWSAELPSPADEPGIYHLRAHFELTAGSCARVREAEYSICRGTRAADLPLASGRRTARRVPGAPISAR